MSVTVPVAVRLSCRVTVPPGALMLIDANVFEAVVNVKELLPQKIGVWPVVRLMPETSVKLP